MLKQGIKIINAEFIQTHVLSQLSSIQSSPYESSFPRFLLSLMLIPKSQKTLEMSFKHTSSFKTSIDARVQGLVSNVDYLENGCYNFIWKNYGRKRHLPHTHVSFSEL